MTNTLPPSDHVASIAVAEHLAKENAALRESNGDLMAALKAMMAALKATLGLIRTAQDRLSLHLQPDSHSDDAEVMGELLEMFDGPRQRAIETAARAAITKHAALVGGKP